MLAIVCGKFQKFLVVDYQGRWLCLIFNV